MSGFISSRNRVDLAFIHNKVAESIRRGLDNSAVDICEHVRYYVNATAVSAMYVDSTKSWKVQFSILLDTGESLLYGFTVSSRTDQTKNAEVSA